MLLLLEWQILVKLKKIEYNGFFLKYPMIQLLPYQQKWVDDKSPFKMCLHRRRVGMSFAEAYSVVDAAQDEYSCICITPRHCEYWLENIQEISAERELRFTTENHRGGVVLKFENHNFIKLLNNNSVDELRGFAGKVVIDDAIWIENLTKIIDLTLPLLCLGQNSISMMSAVDTFDEKPNSFNTFVNYAKKTTRGYSSLHVIAFEQAITDGLYEKAAEAESKEVFIHAYERVFGIDKEVFKPFYEAMKK